MVISPIGNAFTADFLYYLLSSGFVYDQFSDAASGGVVSNLNSDKVADTTIPIPPIGEQTRIVDAIEKWSILINSLEEEKDSLASSITHFKSKILDLAIRGKLVPQDPNDEPAIELLERINPKFTPCDNAHYENIPASWCYAKGKSIFLPMESTKPTGDSFLYVDVDAVNNKKNKITNPKSILSKQAPSRATRKLHEGDVLFSMVRPYLRNIAQVDRDYANAIASTGFYVITPTATIIQDYLFFMMQSSYVVDGLNQFMKGDNSPSITNKDIENYAYPIPPIKEQQRIVAAIKHYYRILDDISANL